MTKMPNYGSLHELLTHQFNPDKLYQFILFPTEVQHTFSRKDNRGKDVPLTKGVFPLNLPYRLEHKTVMLLDGDDKQVVYKDESEKKALIKSGKAKMTPVTVRDCLGEMEVLMHLQTPERDKKHIVTTKNFTDGRITLRGSEMNELKVLASCDAFANKIDRDTKVKALFFLRDEEAFEEQQIEKEDEVFEMEAYVRDLANIDAVSAYARIILTPTEYDKLSANPLAIIRRMAGLAKQNPKEFKTQFNNPANLKLHYIKEAVETGVIRHDERSNALYFQKTGALILQCPFGIDVERQFSDNAMSEQNISAVNNYVEMMKLLRPDTNKKEPIKVEVKTEAENAGSQNQKTPSKYTKEYTAELMNKGVDLGCIEIKNATTGAFDWNKKGDADYKHFKGSKKFSEMLDADKVFEAEVLTKLGIPLE
jgi:hypothetical protein